MRKRTKQTRIFNNISQEMNTLKASGVGISKKAMWESNRRYLEENREVLSEAAIENKVLSMKRFFKRKNWSFPPKHHQHQSVCDMINHYYGKELTTTKD